MEATAFVDKPLQSGVAAPVDRAKELALNLAIPQDMQLAIVEKKTPTKIKMLQMLSSTTMLVRRLGMLCIFSHSRTPPLANIESTAASTIAAAVFRASGATVAANRFKSRVRHATTDDHSSNPMSEAIVKSSRQNWHSSRSGCSSHHVATCYDKVYDIVGVYFAGQVAFSKSLQMASDLMCFKKCVYDVVREKLDIRHGARPQEAASHRYRMITLFTSTKAKDRHMQRVLLSQFPNGDWRDTDRVQYYVRPRPDGKEIDKDTITHMLSSALSSALASSRPSTFRADKWAGVEASIDESAIGFAVHNVYGHAYKKMLEVRGQQIPK
eukprot:6065751-Pyramimonas_sp.AAC.1